MSANRRPVFTNHGDAVFYETTSKRELYLIALDLATNALGSEDLNARSTEIRNRYITLKRAGVFK